MLFFVINERHLIRNIIEADAIVDLSLAAATIV